MSTKEQEFSKKWVFLSMSIFIVIELVIGVFVGDLVVGKYKSIHLTFFLQGLLHLLSYFLGGILIGIISPGLRLLEPALGAFLSVALMLSMTLFTPFSFFNFSVTKLIIGGCIAFFLALSGAKIGERIVGNKVD